MATTLSTVAQQLVTASDSTVNQTFFNTELALDGSNPSGLVSAINELVTDGASLQLITPLPGATDTTNPFAAYIGEMDGGANILTVEQQVLGSTENVGVLTTFLDQMAADAATVTAITFPPAPAADPPTSDLTKAQLLAGLPGHDFDTTVVSEVDKYLTAHNLTTLVTQTDNYPPFTADASGHLPQALLLGLIDENGQTIDTSASGDPDLKALFISNGLTETVTGDKNLLVALDQDANTLILHDTGNDTVFTGDGNDVVQLGAGRDVLVGGNGFGTFTGGSGHDTIIGGSAIDTITLGTDANSTAIAQNAASILTTGGNTQTLYGGVENSTGFNHELLLDGSSITDTNGLDNFLQGSSSPAASILLQGTTTGDTAISAAAAIVDESTGHNTLMAGAGNTTFFVGPGAVDQIYGNATSFGTVNFDQSSASVKSLHTNSAGVTTIAFYDGQVETLHDINQLNFNDGVKETLSPTSGAVPSAVSNAEAHAATLDAHIATILAHYA